MGRILALDYGTRRIGAAVSDGDRKIATPLEVYERTSEAAEWRHYRRLVDEERIERIVIGLPIHNHGGESTLSTQARGWGKRLEAACGVPVVFFDERFTSREAEARLREAGLKASARKHRVDMVAAQILLQDYLDAGCPEAPAVGGSLIDEP
ncbi:MAG: putative pre-16S rRNA nuclease [Isosphaeraceae bacterium]|jgi:putative Holliday junction resolvase|nr:MAG: putative pre-16S rRNA nuclease [Isosphaeraceae bacterium]